MSLAKPSRWRRILLASLALLAVLAVVPVRAESGAPVCPAGESALDEPLAVHAQRLDVVWSRCAGDPAYLAWRGAVLLALGRAREAADALERALLLAPEHRGARLDYARALAALGEVAAARQLYAELAAEADAPPAARAYLDAALAADVPWRGHGALALTVGVDSNLNRAPALDRLTLTVPGSVLVLPLAAAARPRAGAYRQLVAGASLAAADQAYGLDARLEARADDAGGRLEHYDLLAQWRRRGKDGDGVALFGFAELRWQGRILQRAARLGLRHERLASCRRLWGGDLIVRAHPENPFLDHLEAQGHFSWLCDGARPWLAQLALGREFAESRPGGDAARLMLRGLVYWPVARGVLEAEARLSFRREDDGYSPLLANGARLSTQALVARLGWRRPLGGALELLAGGEIERQWANLPLFAQRREALHLGVALRW